MSSDYQSNTNFFWMNKVVHRGQNYLYLYNDETGWGTTKYYDIVTMYFYLYWWGKRIVIYMYKILLTP